MNSQKKLLIAYSSLAGCTEGISNKIEETVRNDALNIDLVKVNEKDQFKKLNLDDLKYYDFILLGSSIVSGKLNKNINKILERLGKDKREESKLGIFICCMKACNEDKIKESIQDYLEPSLEKYNLKSDLMDAFGGKVDFSPNSTMNKLVQKIMKRIMIKDNPDIDEIEPKIYDFRDWTQIERFANSWKELII